VGVGGTGQWVEHQWAGVPSRVLKQQMWGWHHMEWGGRLHPLLANDLNAADSDVQVGGVMGGGGGQ
jgi:hypothetical protein